MSISNIGNSAPNVLRTPAQKPAQTAAQTATQTANSSPVRDGNRTIGKPRSTTRPASGPAAAAAAARGNQSLPVEPPPGTDPALWSVLSGDERAYFARMGAMGPLTYGKVMNEARSAQLPATRGGRLDVKI